MPLHILGLNHNTAPVEIRERVVFAKNDLPVALEGIAELPGIDEAVILSTCNRTEIYSETDAEGLNTLRDWLIDKQQLNGESADTLFTLDNEPAIRHIFRVASGLDSMVLGEPQILGQLKEAYREAENQGTVGKVLHTVFRHTFSVAKKVRTDTEIGSSPVSVAYAAVSLADQFFSGFEKHTALLIGAGTTIELVAKHLQRKKIGRLFIANRSIERAQDLASAVGGFALPLSEIDGTLPEADILISSTASPVPVVMADQMQQAIKQRKRRPVFALDIAVPRDLHPDIGKLQDVYLYTIDDLDKVILESQSNRETAAVEAERILTEETERYLSICRSKEVAPVITSLRNQSDALRQQVAKESKRRLARGESAEDVIDYATAALMKKLLHNPSIRLRAAGEDNDEAFVKLVKELFDLQ